MPAVSRSQQRLMAQAREVRRHIDSGGKEGTAPKDLDPAYRERIVKLARDMDPSDLESFARTSHKDLPDRKVKEDNGYSTVSNVNGMGDNAFPTSTRTGSGIIGTRFMRFQDYVGRRGRRKKKP
jgi:hypothetical protein